MMAAVAALVCTSHTPLMAFVEPKTGVRDEVEALFAKLRAEIRKFAPDLIVLFAPDHFRSFFYDMMPPFCVGARAELLRDFGIGIGRMNVPAELAEDLVEKVHQCGVDVALSYKMPVDHGFAQPLQLLIGDAGTFPAIPIFVNCAAKPLPQLSRSKALGAAVGKWLKTTGRRILIIGSGGLSHDPPVPQLGGASPEVEALLISGRNPTPEAASAREQRVIRNAQELAEGRGPARPLNEDWDMRFMDAIAGGNLDSLGGIGDREITAQAGVGAHEVRTWIAAAAAAQELGETGGKVRYYRPIPEWSAGMGVLTANLS